MPYQYPCQCPCQYPCLFHQSQCPCPLHQSQPLPLHRGTGQYQGTRRGMATCWLLLLLLGGGQAKEASTGQGNQDHQGHLDHQDHQDHQDQEAAANEPLEASVLPTLPSPQDRQADLALPWGSPPPPSPYYGHLSPYQAQASPSHPYKYDYYSSHLDFEKVDPYLDHPDLYSDQFETNLGPLKPYSDPYGDNSDPYGDPYGDPSDPYADPYSRQADSYYGEDSYGAPLAPVLPVAPAQ